MILWEWCLYDTTFPVTMDDMIRHCQAVRRGSPNVFIARDMPYMSYQVSDELAIANACRFVREADGAGLIRDSSVVRPGMQKK